MTSSAAVIEEVKPAKFQICCCAPLGRLTTRTEWTFFSFVQWKCTHFTSVSFMMKFHCKTVMKNCLLSVNLIYRDGYSYWELECWLDTCVVPVRPPHSAAANSKEALGVLFLWKEKANCVPSEQIEKYQYLCGCESNSREHTGLQCAHWKKCYETAE